MPDADKIGKLSRQWLKVYKEVCEGYFDSISLAKDAIVPLRKDIEEYGNPPVHFLKEASNRLESIRNNPLFLPVHDWSEEDRFIDDLKLAYMQKSHRPHQRGINMAISAYKDIEYKLRNGENIHGNLEEALLRGYLHRIYDSNFVDLASLMAESYMDIGDVIKQRLNEMSIFVEQDIEFFALQIAKRGNVKGLRTVSQSTSRKTISIEDDVFSLGKKQ
jgi:hypothetical protein